MSVKIWALLLGSNCIVCFFWLHLKELFVYLVRYVFCRLFLGCLGSNLGPVWAFSTWTTPLATFILLIVSFTDRCVCMCVHVCMCVCMHVEARDCYHMSFLITLYSLIWSLSLSLELADWLLDSWPLSPTPPLLGPPLPTWLGKTCIVVPAFTWVHGSKLSPQAHKVSTLSSEPLPSPQIGIFTFKEVQLANYFFYGSHIWCWT